MEFVATQNNTTYHKSCKISHKCTQRACNLGRPTTGSDKLTQSTGEIMAVRVRQSIGSETYNIALQNPTWTTFRSKSGLHDELGM